MKTLIFDIVLSGHHLEYLHHYYMGAINKQENKYIFVIPPSFEQIKDKYNWPLTDNVTFEYIKEEELKLVSNSNIYKNGWNASKILNKYVRRNQPDKVLLTMLMQYIPFIVFLLPSYVRVRGIMYKIYLYEQKRMSKIRLYAEKVRFMIASHSKIIEDIFVLNDKDSARIFNEIYNTSKFKYLPDPIPSINKNELRDLREDLDIAKDDTIYLHFGGLDKRKGTLDILNAIVNSTDKNIFCNKTIIFAGKIAKSIMKDFYSLLPQAKEQTNILVFDEFCSYEYLYNLCYTCDIILMPYHMTNLSSGVLGYAALFNKPVIGPSDGLIGMLIKGNNLGITLESINTQSITNAFKENITIGSNNYINKNSINEFCRIILS